LRGTCKELARNIPGIFKGAHLPGTAFGELPGRSLEYPLKIPGMFLALSLASSSYFCNAFKHIIHVLYAV